MSRTEYLLLLVRSPGSALHRRGVAPVEPSGRRVSLFASAVGLAALFFVVGSVIALVQLRTSPWYPRFNDVNSDLYVYQMVGNSWRYGFWPYRDVYDVKGPFLYLLFGLFAWIRPWSMGPPLVFLAILASCSMWLAYRIARLYRLSRGIAALCATASCVVIYLSVAVNTSFTPHEIAVPGVLLMLWLVLRLLRSEKTGETGETREEVSAAWWVIDGMVFGALFWTKYQVIAPWAAVFVGLIVLTIRGRLPVRSLRRVAGWNTVGLIATTIIILSCYWAVLSDMAEAYFLGKSGSIKLANEVPAQAAWMVRIVTEHTGAALVLAGILVVFVVGAFRGRADGLVLTIGLVLTMWASASFVRHFNHLFVPLSFTVVALAQVLSAAVARGRPWVRITAAATVVAAMLLIAGPLIEAREKMWLLGRPKRVTCHNLITATSTTDRAQVSTVFARAAGEQPILSVDTLFAARTSFISRQPMRRKFEFVDHSWAWTIGATQVQTRYLRERTFDYVWIHTDQLEKLRGLRRQIEQADIQTSRIRPEQAAAIARNYEPILGCNNQLLLRAR